MSDTQQGEGWWQASDGQWYPPTPPTSPTPPSYAPPPGYGYPPPQPPVGGPQFAPPYPQYAPPQTAGKAIAVLVLGIVGLVMMCGYGIGIIPAIIALALAPGAKREIQGSGGRLQGEGMLKAGVVCSWVTVGLVILGVLFLIVAIIASSVSSS